MTGGPTAARKPTNMSTLRLLSLLILPLLLTACSGGNTQSEGTPSDKTTEAASAEGTKPKKRKSYTAEELNEPYSRVSPWRYIVTSPETQYFERLVGTSTHSKTVHGSGHAILVPEDETFTSNKEWKGILDEENREALDKLVGAHIIIGINGTKGLEGTYENLNGDPVVIERNEKGELVCGGSRLLGREVETDKGLVIPVIGLAEAIRWN